MNSEFLCERLKKYLHDNYLPEPEEIYEDCEFSCRHNYDEQHRPYDFGVTITFEYDDIVDAVMREHLANLGLKIAHENYLYFDMIIAFLHEIGHVATLPHMYEEELDESQVLTAMLGLALDTKMTLKSLLIGENVAALRNSCIAYWNLPVEKAANEWVVNILNLFPSIVDDLEMIFSMYCRDEEA